MSTTALTESNRTLVFIEQVQKTVGLIEIDDEGLMTSLDEGAEQIFQQRAGLLLGDHIKTIIPGILIPG